MCYLRISNQVNPKIQKPMNLQYEIIKAGLNNKLLSEGYNVIEEKYHPETFGNRYIIWSNGKDAKQLIWDGKDQWFYLKETDTTIVDRKTIWKNIVYIPYDSKKRDTEYKEGVLHKILSALN